MSIQRVSHEVFVGDGGIVQVRAEDVAFLSTQARMNPRRRARLCAHPDSQDRLHEMLIVLARGTYIRPHRHAGKSESFHIIEGELDVVVFHDDGGIREIVRMGPYGSGKTFYYRLMEPCYHTVLIGSPYALFHETTNGPFDRADTEFAPWSPAEGDGAAGEYMERLRSHFEPVRQAA
jgi:cupin fold WbuC family metalloprotein